MSSRKSRSMVYRIVRRLLDTFYRAPEIIGLENLPDGPCVIAANHAQLHGPIQAELFFPGDSSIWCNAETMDIREAPAYAYRDFWPEKPRALRWLYWIPAYIVAPILVGVLNSARCIGVYRDLRMRNTIRQTMDRLQEGARIIIFPETDPELNTILSTFQPRFIDLGPRYERATGKTLRFVPMYIAPDIRKIVIGKPVAYDNQADARDERNRICTYLTDAITELAYSLPLHRVVPYRNIKKKLYPTNERPLTTSSDR